MSTKPQEIYAQPWNNHVVAIFNGAFHSNIKTGEDYATITLADIFAMQPANRAKGSGPAFIPSSVYDYDAREHAAQRDRGSFVALCGDVDSGNHSGRKIETAVKAFAPDSAYLIYTSAHARPGEMRWRIILPLHEPQDFAAWYDAQSAFFAFMESHGIEMDHALARAAQPVYLPNVPPIHSKTETPLRGEDGGALYYKSKATDLSIPGLALDQGAVAVGMAEIRRKRIDDEQEREQIRREAEQRRANKPRGDTASIIDDFNATNSVASMLELCSYEQSPRSAEDWRSPLQTGETYATRVIGSKFVSLSASDAASGLGERCKSGCFGDAYDLFAFYKHGGDHKAAYRALYAERRADNVIYPEPPSWMAEAPLPDEAPEDFDLDDAEHYLDLVGETSVTPSLPFFWFNEAEPNLEANDFVEGLLTTSAMSVVYGPSNCGKTFFIVDMALHVAWGREWRGREVDRGAVVYLSLEGSQGIRNRLSAFRKHHGLENEQLPFIAMPKPVNLLNDDADVNAVIALVQHVATVTELPVAMVIVDTLSRAMAGGNENSPEDMTALIGNCDRIRDATGSHVCIVHHSGKDEARGARGHSSLRAATDTEIEIKRDPELTVSNVRIAKQRDLEAGDPFAFSLQKVTLGTNRRNKEVASCVVVEADKTVVLARDPNSLSPKESEAMRSLDDCLLGSGIEIEGQGPNTVLAVLQAAWKRSLQARNTIDRNNDHTARTQFSRIRKALEGKGQITTGGDYVWRA